MDYWPRASLLSGARALSYLSVRMPTHGSRRSQPVAHLGQWALKDADHLLKAT